MKIPAAKAKAYAAKIKPRLEQSGVGSFFDDLLAFLKELVPLIFAMPCFAVADDEEDLASAIDDTFRKIAKRRKGCCPKRVRKLMEKHGCTNDDAQDSVWKDVCEEGFSDSQAAAADLMGAYEDE